jgi:hypothetical protein
MGLLGFFLLLGLPTSLLQAAYSYPAPSEKAYFSLLTGSPGKEVWAQYGHTGIRFCDPEQGLDIVFNYGLFDFSSPHFLWHFITGQTDYKVAASQLYDFMLEFQLGNRRVTEQVINLTQAEKTRLLNVLLTNIEPGNNTYRYNFIYKNCATQPRDRLEENINGRILYTLPPPYHTLREAIHHFTDSTPRTLFGIDFALGSEADEPATLRDLQFAPDILMQSFASARIIPDSSGYACEGSEISARPLVIETHRLCDTEPEAVTMAPAWTSPQWVFWFLFLVTALLTGLEWKKRAIYHYLDAFWFTLAGLAGCVIAFLAFFSQHPCTGGNYLLLWLHPLHLLFAIGLLIAPFRKKVASWYLAVNLPLQFIGLIGFFLLPQAFHPAQIPLLLILMLRSVNGVRRLHSQYA